MRKIIVETKKLKQVVNITPQMEKILKNYPARDGMLHLYLRHTTAALTTAYIEEELDLHMIGAFEVMLPTSALPKSESMHTHHIGHLPAHVVASLLGPHLAIPVIKNKLMLGTFQSVVLVELNGPRKREILVDYREKPRWER
jgi:secondary thiamine-phosphate synthase enzyme